MNEPKIRLVAVDMDGTLLDSEKNPPADFVDWVRAHKDVRTILASGRQYKTLEVMFAEAKDSFLYVADNGGFVFDGEGRMIYSNPMKKEDVRYVIRLFEQVPHAHIILCGAKGAYMRPDDDWTEENARMYYAALRHVDDLEEGLAADEIAKVAVFLDDLSGEAVYASLPAMPDAIAPALSGDGWIDVSNRSVSKGSAIRAIQEEYGIDPADSMAFGDYLNDYDLLLVCGESYAMKNAHPKLKEIAKHVTPNDNDHDGVMEILRGIR